MTGVRSTKLPKEHFLREKQTSWVKNKFKCVFSLVNWKFKFISHRHYADRTTTSISEWNAYPRKGNACFSSSAAATAFFLEGNWNAFTFVFCSIVVVVVIFSTKKITFSFLLVYVFFSPWLKSTEKKKKENNSNLAASIITRFYRDTVVRNFQSFCFSSVRLQHWEL